MTALQFNSVQLGYGIITQAPGTDNYGLVLLGGETRRVYFDPARFVQTWAALADTKVVVQQCRNEWKALQVVGVGGV